jgi:hypothetical protein
MRTYTSTKPDVLPDPIQFELDGVVYTCREMGPLELSEVARLHGAPADSPESLAFMAEFFSMLLGHDQYRAFRESVGKFETRVEVFVEIIQGVFTDFTDRPILPPSDFSDGRPTTGASLTDDSSSRVMTRLAGRPDLQMALVRAASDMIDTTRGD